MGFSSYLRIRKCQAEVKILGWDNFFAMVVFLEKEIDQKKLFLELEETDFPGQAVCKSQTNLMFGMVQPVTLVDKLWTKSKLDRAPIQPLLINLKIYFWNQLLTRGW